MRLKQLLRPGVTLALASTLTAAAAQGVLPSCGSLPPGERESAQAIGACRESAPIVDVIPNNGGARGAPPVVVSVPRVIGLSFDDARSRLAAFTVRRSYVASAEPGGTVLEQQPAPPARLGAGSVVRVVVSDGSLRPAPQVAASEIDGVRKPAEAVPAVPTADNASQSAARTSAQRRAAEASRPIAPSRSKADAQQAPAAKSASTQVSAARSDAPAARPRDVQIPPQSTAPPTPASVIETLELPKVIGRTSAVATAALAEFKVDRIEVVANAAPSGQVLAQDPAPGTQIPPGTSIGLQISDGSLASVNTAAPVTVPPPPARPAATGLARAPMAFPSTAVLLLIAGVLLGLGLGAVLMRRWLAKRHQAATEAFVPTVVPPITPVHTPLESRVAKTVEPLVSSVAPVAAAPVAFAAHLKNGTTTIEFTAPSDADEMTLEYSRDFHE